MNQELIEVLEKKISDIVEKYSALKEENNRLNAEIERLSSDREGMKSRVDAILGKLEGIGADADRGAFIPVGVGPPVKVSHSVRVMGREISVRSSASAESVQAVETFVNNRLQEIGSALSSGDAQLVLTLALLNTTEELLKLRMEREQDATMGTRLEDILKKLETAGLLRSLRETFDHIFRQQQFNQNHRR